MLSVTNTQEDIACTEAAMWDRLFKYMIYGRPATYSIRMWIMSNILEPVLEVAHKWKLTDYKPVTKMTTDDLWI
jgi:hypothetical protein